MRKKIYDADSGCIASGPSREKMFDSLRLGKAVGMHFIFTNGIPNFRMVKITGIKKRYPLRGDDEECNDWIIELLIQERPNSKNMTIPWSGSYSTSYTKGQITSELPKFLISR